MKTVWKIALANVPLQSVEVPVGATILSVGEQFGVICIWFHCDPAPDGPKEKRQIAIVGTGHPAPEKAECRFIGTVALRGGNLMFHVFERTP